MKRKSMTDAKGTKVGIGDEVSFFEKFGYKTGVIVNIRLHAAPDFPVADIIRDGDTEQDEPWSRYSTDFIRL